MVLLQSNVVQMKFLTVLSTLVQVQSGCLNIFRAVHPGWLITTAWWTSKGGLCYIQLPHEFLKSIIDWRNSRSSLLFISNWAVTVSLSLLSRNQLFCLLFTFPENWLVCQCDKLQLSGGTMKFSSFGPFSPCFWGGLWFFQRWYFFTVHIILEARTFVMNPTRVI